MAIDTPAKIAVIGAGPVGLEIALYARFLGYDVEVFDRGEVAQNVRDWGHVRMFSPFAMNSTRLGLAAIAAQDESYAAPRADELLTGHEWADRYLVPLSQTDLLVDHLRRHTEVIAVARRDLLKHERIGDDERAESPFHLVLLHQDDRESTTIADVVIDVTGVFRNPNWFGPGGAPALGERSLRRRIRYDVPDVLGAERARFANKRVLVVGAGHSAATTVVALAELAAEDPRGKVVWVTRSTAKDGTPHPLSELPGDPLVERARLTRRANQLAAEGSLVAYWPATQIQSAAWDDGRRCFAVEFVGLQNKLADFDEIVANVGYHANHSLSDQLQVHQCYATGGPMKLAASLIGSASGDCLKQTTYGAQSLICPEPNFYILGAKSYGRRSDFLVSVGHQQIRELFTLIGDREGLDLYQGATLLPGRRAE